MAQLKKLKRLVEYYESIIEPPFFCVKCDEYCEMDECETCDRCHEISACTRCPSKLCEKCDWELCEQCFGEDQWCKTCERTLKNFYSLLVWLKRGQIFVPRDLKEILFDSLFQ
jgi:hypothetical protein